MKILPILALFSLVALQESEFLELERVISNLDLTSLTRRTSKRFGGFLIDPNNSIFNLSNIISHIKATPKEKIIEILKDIGAAATSEAPKDLLEKSLGSSLPGESKEEIYKLLFKPKKQIQQQQQQEVEVSSYLKI